MNINIIRWYGEQPQSGVCGNDQPKYVAVERFRLDLNDSSLNLERARLELNGPGFNLERFVVRAV